MGAIKTPNWRDALAINKKKSRIVLGIYLGIYAFLGFLVDLVLFYYLFYHKTRINFGSSHLTSEVVSYYHRQSQFVLNAGVNDWLHSFYMLVESAFKSYINGTVIPYGTLTALVIAIFCLIWANFRQNELVLSGTNNHLLTEETCRNDKEKQLLNVVDEMVIAMRLQFRPKVYVINAAYMNAFASGSSEERSMVAITEPLLNELDRAELQAVMAHELSHIKHMDTKLLVTATVLTSLIAITVGILFDLLRVWVWGGATDRDNRRRGGGGGVNPLLILFVIFFILRLLLPVINILLLRFLSRKREFMADAGAVAATRDNQALATALIKIHKSHESNPDSQSLYSSQANEGARMAAYIYSPQEISSGVSRFMFGLMSTHPPLQERLDALSYTQG